MGSKKKGEIRVEKKYAEVLADAAKSMIGGLIEQGIEYILKVAEENKNNIDKWPLVFEISKIVPNNHRLINALVEKLEDKYGFFVLLQKDDFLAVDLPIEIEKLSEDEELMAKTEENVSLIISAKEAAKMSICGREANSNMFCEFVNKKIKDAAKKGENCVNFDFKDKMINKDAKIMKRIYIRLKNLGFDCEENIKRNADKKIMFDKLEVLKVKW